MILKRFLSIAQLRQFFFSHSILPFIGFRSSTRLRRSIDENIKIYCNIETVDDHGNSKIKLFNRININFHFKYNVNRMNKIHFYDDLKSAFYYHVWKAHKSKLSDWAASLFKMSFSLLWYSSNELSALLNFFYSKG